MSEERFIYWRKDIPQKEGMTFANVHLLVGYNQGTITDFQEMAAKIREVFPQAKDNEIHCGKVHISSTCKGFSIVTWDAYIPTNADYPEWHQVHDGKIEYHW
jgi:hypothetical protein